MTTTTSIAMASYASKVHEGGMYMCGGGGRVRGMHSCLFVHRNE